MITYMITFYHMVVILSIQATNSSHIKNSKNQKTMVNTHVMKAQVIRRQLNKQRLCSMFKHHLDTTKQHILIQIIV